MPPKEQKYFLPYQMRWLKDESKIKIWEKSRRIGATYIQSYEDVRDCLKGTVPSVWFTSADESAAKEYILYCSQWAKLFQAAAQDLGEIVIDKEKDIKALVIQFANGRRIHALSSSPKAFRSKGGKAVWDEAAWHDDDAQMWKALKPVTTWGFPIRILSTHNGKQKLFYKFIERINQGKLNWSAHKTTIQTAVADGLVDKILKRKTTEEERAQWLKEQEDDCFDRWTWLEEFCCVPVDEASAFLDYELIALAEEYNILWNEADPYKNKIENDLFVGVDIGRRKDLTVIWVDEKIASVKFTRAIIILERTPFRIQKQVLFNILSHPKVRRACIDASGLGMQLAEECQDQFGKYKVEAITFTGKTKEELAYNLRTDFENKNKRIPVDSDLKEDLHSIRKVTTASNNIRFDVAQSEVSGHADRFWAGALSSYASKTDAGPLIISSGGRRYSHTILTGYGY